ncbi:AraC family transcriptional regulator [Cohnella sp. JJ-181]|uniref:AraC family transcriptional regulator n=1 Tax=Cohnella rhizoplanae TaxID=2974897 RepID=UPI0022FFBAF5|nr:AraC family transcriptional regulator [Cohnella sp. JJ-181]CAI6052591.1 HTH-type transcriptional activator RhaR [Cohnella sp. JJ-181]
MSKDTLLVDYGHEDRDIYLHRVIRAAPFERNNHYHGTYEVYYQVAGRKHHFIKERAYNVAAGDLVFINKYDVHKSSVLGSPQHERIVLNFSDAFLGTDHPLFDPGLLRIFRRPNHLYRLKPQEQWLAEDLFRKMEEEVKNREEGYELALRLLVTQLLLFASRLKEAEVDAADDPLSPTHKRIAEVVRHINAHYAERMALAGLAERFAMSPSYLSRTFKKVTGFTLVGYQNLVRIREAQTLLGTTADTVASISEKVGFEQFAHFNRTFRKVAGTSPTRYRKWNR